MSEKIIVHCANSGFETVDDLIDMYYPELVEEKRRKAMGAAIKRMNFHNGNMPFDSIGSFTFAILPHRSSSAFDYALTHNNPNETSCAFKASSQFETLPQLKREERNHVTGFAKDIGLKEVFHSASFYNDWLNQFKENLSESPVKDSIIVSTKRVIEQTSEHSAKVYEATLEFDKALKKYASSSGKSLRQAAKSEVLEAHKNLQKAIPKAIKERINKAEMGSLSRGMKAIKSPGNAMRSAARIGGSESFVMLDSEYTKAIRILKYGKYASNGLIFFDVGLNTVDVVQAYEKGEDWEELAWENGAGIVGSLAGAALGEFIAGVASGPAAIFTVPVAAVSGSILGEKAAKALVKVIYEL